MADLLTWHVGDVVRKLRLAKEWTQKDLAKKAKLHHNTIVRLEDGDEGVQGRTLKHVAEALGMTRQDLWALVPREETQREATAAHAAAGSTAVDPFRQPPTKIASPPHGVLRKRGK